MRIFCGIRHANDPKQFYGGLWSGNFYPALRQLGHEVVDLQTDLLPCSRFMSVAKDFTREESEMRARVTEQVLAEVRAAHRAKPVQLFLSYFYNSHFDPAGFDELRKLGIPSVNFYCNSIYQFGQVASIAARADFSWHAERDAKSLYTAAGANPVWVQMGADPDVYRPVPVPVRQNKACFIGQRYADRDRWLAALIGNNVPVQIYGPGWTVAEKSTDPSSNGATEYLGRKHQQPATVSSYAQAIRGQFERNGIVGGSLRIWKQFQWKRQTCRLSGMFAPVAKPGIPFQEIAATLSSHDVALNFSNVWSDGQPGSDLIPHVRLRDFEAPMCRTCYLTGETDEIREFYEVGREIDTYATPEELIEKTQFYLKHADAAERMREAGFQRARQDHTWVRRFEELFKKIGLGSAKSNAPATTALRV